jgi:hypothetical protein
MTKKGVMVTIDEYIHKLAKDKNVNVSEVCERALVSATDPYNDLPDTYDKTYPFEVCSETLPETFKTRLFGMVGIKAKRCRSCNKIFFVNDLAGEFKSCKTCWELENKKK